MKLATLIILLVVLFSFSTTSASRATEAENWPGDDYIIGPGDVIGISVWRDEALTQQVIVLPDGRISFPLIGEIPAGGKTVALLTKELKTKLNRYVPDVSLSVVINQVNSMKVYVIGRVNRPGMFDLNSNIDALQALAMAGGLTPFAKRGKIKIFRKIGDRSEIFPFDYDDVAEGASPAKNIVLKRGDVIVVP